MSAPNEITLTISRADAELLRTALCCADDACAIDEQDADRLISLLEDASPAPSGHDAPSAGLPFTKLAAILNACLHNVTIGTTDRIYLRGRLEAALAVLEAAMTQARGESGRASAGEG